VANLNTTELDTDIIYARDMGAQKNLKLMKLYPDREFYLVKYFNGAMNHLIWDRETDEIKEERLRSVRSRDAK